MKPDPIIQEEINALIAYGGPLKEGQEYWQELVNQRIIELNRQQARSIYVSAHKFVNPVRKAA